MKRWMLLLLSCVVLGCSSPFVSIDPEAYRAESGSAVIRYRSLRAFGGQVDSTVAR